MASRETAVEWKEHMRADGSRLTRISNSRSIGGYKDGVSTEVESQAGQTNKQKFKVRQKDSRCLWHVWR